MNDIGLPMAIVFSLISLGGVYYLNQKKCSLKAQQLWFFSNPGFAIYFAGLSFGWWASGLGNLCVAGLYCVMAVSNIKGLWDEYYNDPLAGWYENAKEKVK